MFKKILIADDHAVVRMGVGLAVESRYAVEIDFADTYFEIENILSEKQVDLLIMDLQMPGVERSVIKKIKKTCPSIKIMIFSAYNGNVVLQYIREGAHGYMSKQCSNNEILESIETLYSNGFLLPSNIALDVLHLIDKADPKKILSSREYQIFTMMIKGMGNLEISNILKLRPGTVSTYKKRIYAKLDVESMADLFKNYIEFGED